MPNFIDGISPKTYLRVSWALITGFLVFSLIYGLLGALLAGMAVYVCTQSFSKLLEKHCDTLLAKQISLGIISFLIIGGVVLLCFWTASFLSGQGSGPGLGALMIRMAEIVREMKQILPEWATRSWPNSVANLNVWFSDMLKAHASHVQTAGQDLIKGLTRIVIGMIIGGMISVVQLKKEQEQKPFVSALRQRFSILSHSFSQIVSAQLKISIINTVFTAIFLMVILPITGNPVPFVKTMIVITFIAGLVPVLGNLISNTIITIISLSVSVWVAVSALVFLIVIHKVEYFLNAKIIGGKIQATAWEVLAAMLIMESIFGISGVIAAPIFYAYLKQELRNQSIID